MNTQSKLIELNKKYKNEIKKNISWKLKISLSLIGFLIVSPYLIFLLIIKMIFPYNFDVMPFFAFIAIASLVFFSFRKFYQSKIIKNIPDISLKNANKISDELNEISISPLQAKAILGKKSFIDWNIIEEYRQNYGKVNKIYEKSVVDELNRINLGYQENMNKQFKNIHKVLCVLFSIMLYLIALILILAFNQVIIQKSESLHSILALLGNSAYLLNNYVIFFLLYPAIIFISHLFLNKRFTAFSKFMKKRSENRYIKSVSKEFETKISSLNLSLDESEQILNRKFIYHFKNIK